MVGTRTTRNLVPEAPTLPAPKTPSAVPFCWGGNQAEFQDMPTVKELPARPKKRVHTSRAS